MSSARDPLPARDPRPRRGLAPREGSGAAGSVTAELALALPSVVLLLAVVLAAGDVVAGQIRCVDAARAGARAAARGDPPAAVAGTARAAGPTGARVSMQRSGSRIAVEVTARIGLPLPGGAFVTVRSRALADVEQL